MPARQSLDVKRLAQRAQARFVEGLAEGRMGVDRAADILEPRAHLAVLAREVRRRLALRLGETEPERAIPWLAAQLADDPYDEPCHVRLITSMVRLGRFGEAQRAHDTYAAAMVELGLPVTALADIAG